MLLRIINCIHCFLYINSGFDFFYLISVAILLDFILWISGWSFGWWSWSSSKPSWKNIHRTWSLFTYFAALSWSKILFSYNWLHYFYVLVSLWPRRFIVWNQSTFKKNQLFFLSDHLWQPSSCLFLALLKTLSIHFAFWDQLVFVMPGTIHLCGMMTFLVVILWMYEEVHTFPHVEIQCRATLNYWNLLSTITFKNEKKKKVDIAKRGNKILWLSINNYICTINMHY